jgi:hypothetical protein
MAFRADRNLGEAVSLICALRGEIRTPPAPSESNPFTTACSESIELTVHNAAQVPFRRQLWIALGPA